MKYSYISRIHKVQYIFGGMMDTDKILMKMRKHKKAPCSFRLNSLLLDKLKKTSEKYGVSQSNLIENLIFAGLVANDAEVREWLF